MNKNPLIIALAYCFAILILSNCTNESIISNIPEKNDLIGTTPLPGLALEDYRTETDVSNPYKKKDKNVNWKSIDPLLKKVQAYYQGRQSVALVSKQISDSTYEYKMFPLAFSKKTLRKAKGKYRPFFLEYSYETENGTQVFGVFTAYIPDTERAEKEVLKGILGKEQYKAMNKTSNKNKYAVDIRLTNEGCYLYYMTDQGTYDKTGVPCPELVPIVTGERVHTSPFPPIEEFWLSADEFDTISGGGCK